MHGLMRFVKATFVGGLVVLLPAYLAVLVIGKGIEVARRLVHPVVNWLPETIRYPDLAGAVVLVLACFVTGLLVMTPPARALGRVLERYVLQYIPFYALLRSMSRRLAGQDTTDLEPALVEIESGLVPCFIVERHDDGRRTVFVPAAPTPAVGSIYIMPGHLVHPTDVPMAQALKCITHWGSGAKDLVAAMRPPKR